MAHSTKTSVPPPPERSGGGTVAALWATAVAGQRRTPAYLVERDGSWEEVTWDEAAARVRDLAHGLLALGLKKGDVFALLAGTRLEWVLLDFALASLGVIVVPIYPSSSASDCAHVLGHSEAIGVAVEDDAQLAKVERSRSELPALTHVVHFGALDDLAERGRAHARANPGAVEAAASAIREDDVLTYLYTSGTTGPPKGCVITHENFFAMTAMVGDALGDVVEPRDVVLLFLPLAHNFGRLLHLAGAYLGFTTALCPDLKRVRSAIEQVRPTILPSVPRVFETVHGAVRAQLDAATGLRRVLADWSLAVGRRASAARQQGRPLPPLLSLQHRLADRLVYSKVKARLGCRIRLGISGGAPLAQEIAELFHALDILILEGYGLTECTSACSVNRPDRFRFGTVGPALPGCQVEIAPDGEILIRGRNVFAGYLKDERATREVLRDDGWLASGDVGELDADGFLKITDRKKDLIVTAGGKNVSPQNIENALKRSKYVSHALVIGDRRPYITALVTLDEQELRGWAREQGLRGELAELARKNEVRRLVQSIVESANADRAPHERVRRFAVLERDFSQEAGEVTPTLKLKRRVCEQHFAGQIDSLYRGPAA